MNQNYILLTSFLIITLCAAPRARKIELTSFDMPPSADCRELKMLAEKSRTAATRTEQTFYETLYQAVCLLMDQINIQHTQTAQLRYFSHMEHPVINQALSSYRIMRQSIATSIRASIPVAPR